MQPSFRTLFAAATIILFASCTKSNTQGKLIPKEASFVLQLNGKSLASKLSWDEVKQNPLFKDANIDSSMPSAMKQVLNNPDSAGIDATGDFVFFVVKDSTGNYVAFEGSIKNENQFKAFNKQFTENGTESEKDGVNFISKAPLCIGYSKDKFVYVFDTPQMGQMDAFSKRMKQDSIDITIAKPRDIGATCKAIFALEESNSLAKNEKFTTLMKESGDIRFWMNAEQLMAGVMENPIMSMVDMGKFYKGSITTAAVTFDNGKISFAAKSYMADDMIKIYKKYSGTKISEDMLKRIPGKDVVGLLAINFNPEIIREILKTIGLDGMANVQLTKIGFTLDDLIKSNKGDLLMAVSDLTMKPDSMHYNFSDKDEVSVQEKPVFKYVLATSVGDKDAFNKVMAVGKKFLPAQTDDSNKAPFAYDNNGTYFTVADSKEDAAKFLAGTNTNFDFISKINGQAFGGYLNIQLMMKAFEAQAAKDSSAKVVYDASVKIWDNILMKGGDINGDNALTQSIEINLMDKSTNSLKQLNQYAIKLSEVYKTQREKQKANTMADEDATTTTIDTVVAVKPAHKKKK